MVEVVRTQMQLHGREIHQSVETNQLHDQLPTPTNHYVTNQEVKFGCDLLYDVLLYGATAYTWSGYNKLAKCSEDLNQRVDVYKRQISCSLTLY